MGECIRVFSLVLLLILFFGADFNAVRRDVELNVFFLHARQVDGQPDFFFILPHVSRGGERSVAVHHRKRIARKIRGKRRIEGRLPKVVEQGIHALLHAAKIIHEGVGKRLGWSMIVRRSGDYFKRRTFDGGLFFRRHGKKPPVFKERFLEIKKFTHLKRRQKEGLKKQIGQKIEKGSEKMVLETVILGILVLAIIAGSIRLIQQYETSIVFRLGKFHRTMGPGLNFIIPIIDRSVTIDMRVLTIDIPRQQAITKDNVPVSINGVVYFKVADASKAIINVQDYVYAVSQYAQTALRDVVGGMSLDDVLAERQKIGEQIEIIVEKQAKTWGLEIDSIKMQDIELPEDLKRIMSRQASAEREKRANITKSEGDKLAAQNLSDAARIMATTPGAMQLRTLQSIDGLGPTPSNTVILVPVDLFEAVKDIAKVFKKK